MLRIIRTLLLAISLTLALPSVAFASEGDIAAARALATQGIEAFRDKRYEESIELLRRAEAVLHAPTHLLFMARAHKQLGHPVNAYELYNKVLRERLAEDAPAAFLSAQEAAREEIKGLEAQIAFATIKLEGANAADVQVFVDDQEIAPALIGVKIPVNPGEHTVRVEGDGVVANPIEFSVAPSKHEAVRIIVKGAPPGADTSGGHVALDEDNASRVRAPVYVALGVGAAGAIFGGVFAGVHFAQKGKAKSLFDEAGCQAACFESEHDAIVDHDEKAANAGTLSLIGFGVGAAGLATGVTLLLLNSSDSSSVRDASSAITVQPAVGWGYLGATGSF